VTLTPLTPRRRAPRGSGDQLHDEILDAATELLLKTGDAKAVSIRAVAKRVGITPPSIYLHFADKGALLDAVCAQYLEKLDETMQLAAVGQQSTLDVLRAQGLSYVRFAVATPELYRIATMCQGTAGSDVDATLTSSAFIHMCDAVAALMDEGIYAPRDPTVIALQLWSAAHGVAALLIAKPYFPFGEIDTFTDQVLRAVCCGHIVAGIVGPASSPQQTVDWLFAQRDAKEDSNNG
jgi:AcrR family transcriptional regulator